MPTYSYVAVDSLGKEKKGTLDASNREEASLGLRQNGLTIVSVVDALAISKDLNISFLEQKPKPRDLSVFCRQFVSIISAGVNVISALEMLSEQTENKRLQKALYLTKVEVEKGESLADAMRGHKGVFSDIFITMVEAGEASGSLETSFTRMAEQFEKEAKLKATIKKATIYPIVLGVVTVAVVFLLLTFVIPTFQDMFDQLDTDLPALTVAVIAASKFMVQYWYIVIAFIVGIVVVIRLFAKSEAGKHFFGRLAMKLPLFGKLTTKTAAALMSRTLSTLLAAGIPMIQAIEITASTMSNVHFKEALMNAREEVAMGTNLSAPIKNSGIFPPLVHHMLSIGEETGSIEGMLTKLADYYDEEVENATQQLTAAMEPAIIVVMAAVVGTLIMAVLMPMAEMYSALDKL